VTAFRALTGAVVMALTGLSLAAPSYAARHQIPATIASDCSVDVTRPILGWIASVPDNSTLGFGAGACYRIDGTLELRNRKGLDLEGNGATFRATTTGDARRSQWRLVGGSRFILRNMTIRGASPVGGTHVPDLQHQHAFDLLGVAGVEIDHAAASDLYGDCVYVGPGWNSAKSWSSGVHVHDSTCTRNGRQGIAVVAGRDVLLENNSLSQIALNAFDVEPTGAGLGARNVTVRANQVSGALNKSFFAAVGDGPVDSVTVEGNRLTGAGMYMAVIAPHGQRRSNIAIIGNSSDTGYHAPGSVALYFQRVDRLTVRGNTIPLSGPNMALASVSQSCGVTVSGNSFPGGVGEARISPYSCRASTSTTLHVSGRGKPGPSGDSAVHVYGRVKGSTSGRVVLRLDRFDRRTHAWVKVRTRRLRTGRRGRFGTRVSGLGSGRWRAMASFRGTRNRAPSRSSYRYFRVR
jgi:hypothetical protein